MKVFTYIDAPDGRRVIEEALALSNSLHIVYIPHVHRVVTVHARDLVLQRVVRHSKCIGVASIAGHGSNVAVVEASGDVDTEVVGAW